MIKKISVSAILFFAVIAASSASETAEFNIGYRGLTWDESLSDALPADKKNEVTSYLDNQFKQILTSSGLFAVSGSPREEGKREEHVYENYSLFPVITVFKQVESEISGYFFDCRITLAILNNSDTEAVAEIKTEAEVNPEADADLNTESDGSGPEVFYLKHIGSGENSAAAMQKSLEGIVDQFEFLLIGFEQWSDSFRVIDIYQGTVIINSGKKGGLRKGDFLHSFDPWNSGKITGDFVVEKTDGDISYARILKVNKYPKAGDPLRLDDFTGFSVNGYTDYFSGEEFSGITTGVSLIWMGGLYVFHPLAGFEYFSIKNINDAFIDILIPYGGFKIVRHIGSMTLSSLITAGAGYVSDSDLYSTVYRGWQYKGGTVKASAERRFGKRFSLFAEAGYSYWYSGDVKELTDIAGFLAGGGVSVKFQYIETLLSLSYPAKDMKYYEYDTDDMIAALATPWGESALAVIRTSGDGCIEALSPCFRGKDNLSGSDGYSLHYGRIIDPDTGNTVDQVVAGVYRKPRSYTGQDMVEIFCHGSMPGITGILDALRNTGFRDAAPGEFTLRAFLNGKMDLTGAEAVNEIIRAKSPQAMGLALERLSGSVFNSINSIKTLVSGILAEIELQLDYAEDEADPEAVLSTGKIETAISGLKDLASTYRIGKVIQEGVRAVLTGRTNAGKSSLFNLLNRAERAIVSEYHGTTRDYIESLLVISGIPVKLYDTAGIRVSDHPVEAEGIKKSGEIIEASDIIIYLVDGCDGLTDEDIKRIDLFDRKKLIKVWNKSDISTKVIPEDYIAVSSLTGSGLDDLEKEIVSRAGAENIMLDDRAVIDSQRQKTLIDSALLSLENSLSAIRDSMPLDVVAVDIKEALDSLGEITGEITTADILDLMFSRFCVGK